MVDSTSSSQTQDRGVSFLYMGAAFVIVVAGLRAAESILNPLLLAVFLSVITAPAYFGLIKRKIADWLALLIVIGVLSATLIGVVFFVTGSIASFTSDHQQDHYRDKLQEKRALMARAIQQFVEKVHGTRRMGQGHQTGMMHGGDQQAGGDTDRFHGIVMFHLAAIRQDAVPLGKDRDKIRRSFEERFVFVRTQRGKGI